MIFAAVSLINAVVVPNLGIFPGARGSVSGDVRRLVGGSLVYEFHCSPTFRNGGRL
jgi:hypothetical protein